MTKICLAFLWLIMSPLFTAAGEFELVGAGRAVPVVVADGEPEHVRLAAEDLASDVWKITGRKPEVISRKEIPQGDCIFIGTVSNQAASRIFSELKIQEAETLAGKWESYRVVSVPGGRMIVAGSDSRGTMFGLYAFIEQYLRVDPLWFWSGREPGKQNELKWE